MKKNLVIFVLIFVMVVFQIFFSNAADKKEKPPVGTVEGQTKTLKPDLVITKFTVRYKNCSCLVGTPFIAAIEEMKVHVKNDGYATSPSTDLNVEIFSVGPYGKSGGILIKTIPSLNRGEGAIVEITTHKLIYKGDGLKAVVDPYNRVDELNELNNSMKIVE